MSSITSEPTGHKIGTTTIGATGGTALAGAIAVLIVWALSEFGIEIPAEVHTALVVIIASIGALIGGKLTPTDQAKVVTEFANISVPTDSVTPTPLASPTQGTSWYDVPGTGKHRATEEDESYKYD